MPNPFIPKPPSALSIPPMDFSYQGVPYVDLTLQDESPLGDLDYFFDAAPYVPATPKPVPEGGTIVGGLGRLKAPAPPFYPVSDEGGEVVVYRPKFDLTTGAPFFVQLVDDDSDAWPQGELGCWAGRPSGGAEIYPTRGWDAISFVLPALPLGVYAMRITDGTGAVRETVVSAFEVLRRSRYWPEGYSFIGMFPPRWPLGPREPQAEPFAEPGNRPPYNGWQALGKALGRYLHAFSGAPCTRLRADLSPGDTVALVETTFLFEPVWSTAEYVWIDGERVRFFGADRALRALALTSPDLSLNKQRTVLERAIPGGTPVVLDTLGMPHVGKFTEPDLGNEPATGAIVYEYTNDALAALATTGTINPFTSIVFWSRQDSAGDGGWLVRGGGVNVKAFASGAGYKILFGTSEVESVNTFTFNQRYCIIVTATGSAHNLYVDGVLEATYAAAGVFGSGGVIFVGWPDTDAGTFYPRRSAANINFLNDVVSAAAAISITDAGVLLNINDPVGDWPGATVRERYIDPPESLVIASLGTGGVNLTLNAACKWGVVSV